jgi:hypothetical protein
MSSSDPQQDPNPYASQTTSPIVNVPGTNPNLTPIDWVICVLCSGIGCIIGIVRMVQGKPSGAKMLGVSVLFMIIWTVVRLAITFAIEGAQN